MNKKICRIAQLSLPYALLLQGLWPLAANAALVDLATQPLVMETTGNVKPNILFILDDSGSMDEQSVPDWADNYPIPNHKNAKFNALAYNPEVYYAPPVYYNTDNTANTSSYPNQVASVNTNWTAVKSDRLRNTGNTNLTSSSNNYYFTYTTGQHCTDKTHSTCTASATPVTGTHEEPAYVRWCTDAMGGTCRALYSSVTHEFPEWPGQGSSAVITPSVSGGNPLSTLSVVGYGVITNASATSVSGLINAINACTIARTGNCSAAYTTAVGGANGIGFSAIADPTDANRVLIFAPNGHQLSAAATITETGGGEIAIYQNFNDKLTPGSQTKVVVSTGSTYSKGNKRIDCAGATTCTGTEEMINYANWWAYYHIRTTAMKTSVSRAFTILDGNFRVAYNTINNNEGASANWDSDDAPTTSGRQFLKHDEYKGAHRQNFLLKLFKQENGSGTPLPTALSTAGRMYANAIPTYTTGGWSPVNVPPPRTPSNMPVRKTTAFCLPTVTGLKAAPPEL